MRHPVFLFRRCRRPATRGPLLARVFAVPGLALVFVAACCCPPPPTGSPLPLRGDAFLGWWCPAARLPLLPLCLVVALRCLAVCRRLLSAPPPPPPPGLVYQVLAPAARFPLSTCFCLVFSVPLALAPVWLGFLFPPRLALEPSHPPPRAVAPGGVRCPASCAVVLRLSVGCCVRRAVFCCCAGALLCAALLCCVVGRLPLASFLLVSLGARLCRAVLCDVSSCVVPSCVVVCCGVVLVAVWCHGCSLSAFSVLRTCGFAPAGAAPPPPPVSVSCPLPVCVAAVCWLVLPFVVPCCCLLRCVVRGAACRVVLCRVLLCPAGGVMLRCVSSCGCALLRALPCSVALCCVVVRCAVRWAAASWCSVLCCPSVCCCGLLCAVWCPLALCGWLRAVLRCCLLLCAVLRLWAWCLVALCSAVLVVACCFVLAALLCAVLGRVTSCCAVLLCTALWG